MTFGGVLLGEASCISPFLLFQTVHLHTSGKFMLLFGDFAGFTPPSNKDYSSS